MLQVTRDNDRVLNERDIADLSYVELMATIGETNRPPGGLAAVLSCGRYCRLGDESSVLDVGCNTGFVSIALARYFNCKVTGLDLDPLMVRSALEKSRGDHLASKLDFQQGDAQDLQFDDEAFDLVLSGGSIAFVDDTKSALTEMIRVTKTYGFIASMDFYYHQTPPSAVSDNLREVLGFEIQPFTRSELISRLRANNTELVTVKDLAVGSATPEQIVSYSSQMAKRVSAKTTEGALPALEARLQRIFSVFSDNQKHLSAVLVIARKVHGDAEPQLFDSWDAGDE